MCGKRWRLAIDQNMRACMWRACMCECEGQAQQRKGAAEKKVRHKERPGKQRRKRTGNKQKERDKLQRKDKGC